MEKRRKNDNGLGNGVRKHISPQALVAFVIIIGVIVTFVSNVRIIPELSKKVIDNVSRIDVVETKLELILM